MATALVVDDSRMDLGMITSCLAKNGIATITAENGEQAIEILKSSQKPDLIILDVVLPGESGFQICRKLKADTETSKIPVIICSTKGTEMDKFWGLKQGADAYLPKPVQDDELLQTVHKLLK
ncbi:MAG: response regulator [Symploca sp. SIO2B6]|nr:response regulator [Symploca sp. SIO2B6]